MAPSGEPDVVAYTGPPMVSHRLASALKDEGVEVEREPPTERRDLAGAATDVAVTIVAYGSLRLLEAAVAKFRERWSQGDVNIDDDPTGYM